MPHPARVDPHRLGPAEVDQEDRDRPQGIQVVTRIQRKASVDPRRLIPPGDRDPGVGVLVQDQAQEQAGDEIEGGDDELLRVAEEHGPKCMQAPGHPIEKASGRPEALGRNRALGRGRGGLQAAHRHR